MSGFDLEREVSLGPCPICGKDAQFMSASLMEVRISCYCNEETTVAVTSIDEERAALAWKDLVGRPVVVQPGGWLPVRHVVPEIGRHLVSIVKDGARVVSIAKWDGSAWTPPVTVEAWAPLPEAWS